MNTLLWSADFYFPGIGHIPIVISCTDQYGAHWHAHVLFRIEVTILCVHYDLILKLSIQKLHPRGNVELQFLNLLCLIYTQVGHFLVDMDTKLVLMLLEQISRHRMVWGSLYCPKLITVLAHLGIGILPSQCKLKPNIDCHLVIYTAWIFFPGATDYIPCTASGTTTIYFPSWGRHNSPALVFFNSHVPPCNT